MQLTKTPGSQLWLTASFKLSNLLFIIEHESLYTMFSLFLPLTTLMTSSTGIDNDCTCIGLLLRRRLLLMYHPCYEIVSVWCESMQHVSFRMLWTRLPNRMPSFFSETNFKGFIQDDFRYFILISKYFRRVNINNGPIAYANVFNFQSCTNGRSARLQASFYSLLIHSFNCLFVHLFIHQSM